MAFTSEQNINISVDKTNVGITATSTDFNKLLTDNFNVTVSTNNSTGYVLNMAVDSSGTNGATIDGAEVATNALVNTEDNKYYLPSITSSIINPTDSTFPTNSWAYSISSTSTNMTYSPLPQAGSSAEIKKVTSLVLEEDADGNLTADDVTPVTVATKADMSVPAGAYTNKLVFTAITNFNPEYDNYTIAYSANGGAGEMDVQYATPSEDVTLAANVFSRMGYTFMGWNTDQNATSALYTDGQTIIGGLSDTMNITITLYAIWVQNAAANTIVYNANGADGGDMSMVTHTSINNGATVQLYAQNYWRKGYGFLGWSTDPAAESKIGTSNPATIYGPNETITASSTMSTQGMILFAVWKKSEGNLQNWNGCSNMSIGDTTALTDTRDGDTYAVGKLADGNCWLMENLRVHSGEVTAENTNNPIDGFAWTESTNTLCVTYDATCYNQVVINTNNVNHSLTASPTANDTNSSWYAYGTWYNWYTTTGGQGTYEMASGSASGSICPVGWSIPTGSTTGEYQALYVANDSSPANMHKYPTNFIFSGQIFGSTVAGRGSNGRYWSSTALNVNSVYDFRNTADSISNGSYYKYSGRTTRCIADRYAVDIMESSDTKSFSTGAGNYRPGDQVTLTLNGFHNITWAVVSGGVTLSSTTANTVTFTMPNNNVQISVYGSPNTYTIVYNSGGGSGTMNSTPATYGQNVTLRTNTFTRTNYAFLGWSHTNGASVRTYVNSQTLATKTITDAANKTTTNGATITLYAVWQSTDPCANLSVGGTCTYNGVTFVKLKDNKLWTKYSQGSATWSTASSKCPSGTYLPSAQNFNDLLTAYGGYKNSSNGEPYGWADSDADVYNATGWTGFYWSSTEDSSNTAYAWSLYMEYAYSGVNYNAYKTDSENVVCIRSS